MQDDANSTPGWGIPARILLDEVEVRPESCELVVDGRTVHIKPKVMDVLTQLIAARGSVVTKSAMLERVWPNMLVAEGTLTEAIHELRRALTDDARNPRFIQTVPRRGYRMVASIRTPARPSGEEGASRTPNPRIAVAFFKSLSADPDDAYFCEGLCEELINSLGRIRHVDVLARTSILEATGVTNDLRLIARRLGASHLVSGTLRKEGKRMRIIAHLVEGTTGHQIWSEAYDKQVQDVIAVQDDIARQIGAAVAPHLEVVPAGEPAIGHMPDPEAFSEFSKGRYLWKQDNANPDRAISRYRRAIEIDPDFAAPYAGMVECYNTIGVFHLGLPSCARDAAIQHAGRALFLEPGSPETLFAFGYTQFYMHWDWETAEAALKKCLSINPNHVLAHGFLSLLLCPLGRRAESQVHAETATRLDPFSPLSWWLRALHCHYYRDFGSTLAAAGHGLELRPEDMLLRWAEADSLVRLNRHAVATKSVRELDSRSVGVPLFQATAGLLYSMLGLPEDAARVFERLQLPEDGDPEDPFVCSLVAIAGKDIDCALDMLERAEQGKDPILWIIACEPYFDPLRSEIRFSELLQRLRLSA